MAILDIKHKIEPFLKSATGYIKLLLSSNHVVMENGKDLETSFNELNGKIEDVFYVKSYDLDNKSLAANTTEFIDVDVPTIKGYSRFNYEVSISNATSSGANSSFCTLYQSMISGGVVRCGIRNNASANAKIKITVRMSYVKEVLVKI